MRLSPTQEPAGKLVDGYKERGLRTVSLLGNVRLGEKVRRIQNLRNRVFLCKSVTTPQQQISLKAYTQLFNNLDREVSVTLMAEDGPDLIVSILVLITT